MNLSHLTNATGPHLPSHGDSSITNMYSLVNGAPQTTFILMVILLFVILCLKLASLGIKWRKNKLTTADVISETNALLTGLIETMSQHGRLSPKPTTVT